MRSYASSNYSNSETGLTQGGATQNIQAPSNLKAANIKSNEVSISWSLPQNTANITGYKVYRDNNLAKTFTNSLESAFTDTGLSPSTTYQYRVASYNASSATEASTPPLPITTLASSIGGTGGLSYTINGEGGWTSRLTIMNQTVSTIASGWLWI